MTESGALIEKYTLIVWLSMYHAVFSYQPLPFNSMDREKGDFLGCFLDLTVAPDKSKTIEGSHGGNECVELCYDHFYRYALIKQTDHCLCRNYLGDLKSDKKCGDFCKGCDLSAHISDVFNTAIRMNGPPTHFQVTNITDTSAILMWNEPESFLSIDSYKLIAKVVETPTQSEALSYSWINIYSNDTFRVPMISLHPGTKYNLTIQADGTVFKGAIAHQEIETLIGEPDTIPIKPKILKKHETSMEISIEPVYNNNGPVSQYLVIVVEGNSVQTVEQDMLKNYREANADGLSYYVTAALSPNRIDKSFTIGDGQVYGRYFNAPLQSDKDYDVVLGMVSERHGRKFVVCSPSVSARLDVNQIIDSDPMYYATDNNALIVTLSIAIVIISLLLIVSLVVFYLLRNRIMFNRRQRLTDNQELTIQGPMIDVENNGYIPEDELPQPSNHYQALKEKVWAVPRIAINVDKARLLGHGEFGNVFAGTVLRDNQLANVAIYVIPDKKMQRADKRSMLKELDLVIRSIGHSNVVELIGTCDQVDNVQVLFEFSNQTLKEFLLQHRRQTINTFSTLSSSSAIDLAYNIIEGMEHLHSNNIIHEKLCPSNVLIIGRLAKVAGFGLTAYYKDKSPCMLRYTAREIFQRQTPTCKTDVWSFAVILWETCALGATPYKKFANHELPEVIVKGSHGLPQLPYVHDTLYQVMLNCWQMDWDERPTFGELREHIDFIRHDDCLSFNLYPGFEYEQYLPELEANQE